MEYGISVYECKKKKKKLHSIFTIKRTIVPSAYGLVHGGRSSRQLVGGSRYPAAPLYGFMNVFIKRLLPKLDAVPTKEVRWNPNSIGLRMRPLPKYGKKRYFPQWSSTCPLFYVQTT